MQIGKLAVVRHALSRCPYCARFYAKKSARDFVAAFLLFSAILIYYFHSDSVPFHHFILGFVPLFSSIRFNSIFPLKLFSIWDPYAERERERGLQKISDSNGCGFIEITGLVLAFLRFRSKTRSNAREQILVAEVLIKEKKVKVLIGIETWQEAALVADVGNRAQIPVISFAAPTITPPLVKTTGDIYTKSGCQMM